MNVSQLVELALTGKLKYSEKPIPVPLRSPQTPYDLTWDRTQTAVVGTLQPTT
jgi:hypothetical protein